MMIKKEELVAASQLQPQLATMMLIGVFIYHWNTRKSFSQTFKRQSFRAFFHFFILKIVQLWLHYEWMNEWMNDKTGQKFDFTIIKATSIKVYPTTTFFFFFFCSLTHSRCWIQNMPKHIERIKYFNRRFKWCGVRIITKWQEKENGKTREMENGEIKAILICKILNFSDFFFIFYWENSLFILHCCLFVCFSFFFHHHHHMYNTHLVASLTI